MNQAIFPSNEYSIQVLIKIKDEIINKVDLPKHTSLLNWSKMKGLWNDENRDNFASLIWSLDIAKALLTPSTSAIK
jgi:hypothetical protein